MTMLELKSVSKRYAGGQEALHDVSLCFPAGQIVGLFGENGAGKTTLMKCILGYLRHEGSVLLDGQPVNRRNIHRISFATCEHSFFPNLSPSGHQAFYEECFPAFRRRRFQGLMDFFELPMGKSLRQFSTGQKNQFEVIMALCQGADYILMDEPFAGNDVFNREDFYKVLLGVLEPSETLILSTHLLEEVSHFIGRAVLLRKGRVVGETSMQELEDAGTDLMQFVRQMYHYRPERVSLALDQLTGEEDAP